MKSSSSKVLVFGFIVLIILLGIAFYAGALTKHFITLDQIEEGTERFSLDSTNEENVTNGINPAQPNIDVSYAKTNGLPMVEIILIVAFQNSNK